MGSPFLVRVNPKIRRDLAYFGQSHLEKPRPNSGRGKVSGEYSEDRTTLQRQSYTIREMAAAALSMPPRNAGTSFTVTCVWA
jgi:hypothetical protein